MCHAGVKHLEFRMCIDKLLVLLGIGEYFLEEFHFELRQFLASINQFLDIQDSGKSLFFEAKHYSLEYAFLL